MTNQQLSILANDFKFKYIEYLKNPSLCNMINYIEVGSKFQMTPYTYDYEGTEIYIIKRNGMELVHTIDVSDMV